MLRIVVSHAVSKKLEEFTNVESFPQLRPRAIDVMTWREFKAALAGRKWCDVGYCSDCYKKLEAEYNEVGGKFFKLHSRPIEELLDGRRVADGWLVTCDGCGRSVFRTALKTTG